MSIRRSVLLTASLALASLLGASGDMAQAAWSWTSSGPNAGVTVAYGRQPYQQSVDPQPQVQSQHQLAQYVSPKILRKQAELEERRRRKQAELNERIYQKYGYGPRQRYYEGRPPRYFDGRPPRYYDRGPRYYERPPRYYYEAQPRYGW